MNNLNSQSFSKSERISRKLIIDSLFGGGKSSVSAFPLRMVYAVSDFPAGIPAAVLISVPKKRFHNAVDRNRMKRQIREAYRRHKGPLWEAAIEKGRSVNIAFICITDRQSRSDQVERSVERLITKLIEKL